MLFDNLIAKKGSIKMKIIRFNLSQAEMYARIIGNAGVTKGGVLEPVR